MILLGADPLSRFLNCAAERPFVWGGFDCLLWLADWIVASHGADPAAELRGRYTTMLGAARVVRQAGSMASLVDRCVVPHGIARTTEPQRGDIAIVTVPGVGGENFGNEAGGILLEGTVALICQDGLLFNKRSTCSLIAAWRV